MNAITHADQSFDFETIEELLQTPLVQQFKPEGLLYHPQSGWLSAVEGGVAKRIGTLREPVRFPESVTIESGT